MKKIDPEKLKQVRQTIKKKLLRNREQKARPKITPDPRYDDVFYKGMEWLNGGEGTCFPLTGDDNDLDCFDEEVVFLKECSRRVLETIGIHDQEFDNVEDFCDGVFRAVSFHEATACLETASRFIEIPKCIEKPLNEETDIQWAKRVREWLEEEAPR